VIETYISNLLSSNFVGLEQIVSQYSKDDTASDASLDQSMGGGTKLANLDGLDGRRVESVIQDFSYTYKQKAEMIAKELRQDLL
jgi:hypothetical protein